MIIKRKLYSSVRGYKNILNTQYRINKKVMSGKMSIDKAEKLSGKLEAITARRGKYTKPIKSERAASKVTGKILKEQSRLGFGGLKKSDLMKGLMGK